MSRSQKPCLRNSRLAQRRHSLWLSVAVLLALAVLGCMSVPKPESDPAAAADALKAHVLFLSQPALKGRKPETKGSRLAREYIERRFKTDGLMPWGEAESYELTFGYGRNVVGVLPGADPALEKEIVLLSAHYDHLGRDSKGRICPGAADNAAGVAALLETARWLSQPEHRPKRSVAFAAFDCEEEMLLGSMAFTCRKDVESARLAAVVNLDILGRNFLDAVSNTLFVAGTERYPALKEQVLRAATNAAIRLLPVGTDLVGPRSDHASFESRDVPCLFFSAGVFSDYHEPTDTADKLDYTELDRSVRVVRDLVAGLAENAIPAPSAAEYAGALDELRTVTTVFSEVSSNAPAGIKPADLEQFGKLASAAEAQMRSGRYDRESRERFVLRATGILTPYLLPFDKSGRGKDPRIQQDVGLGMQYLECLYLEHRRDLMEGYRKLVAQLLKYRPGAFRSMPAFEYRFGDVADEDICFSNRNDGTVALHVLIAPVTIRAEVKTAKWLLHSFNVALGSTLNGIDCEGSRQEVTDVCLLRLETAGTNEWDQRTVRKVLGVITGAVPTNSCAELVEQRTRRGEFKDETDWMASCILSENADLSRQAISAAKNHADPRILEAACRVITDSDRRPDVRAAALDLALEDKSRESLLAASQILSDTNLAFATNSMAIFGNDYPFAERNLVQTLRPLIEAQLARPPDATQTLGDLACKNLKKATGKDFGKDAPRWRTWIESH